jgi:hypothetical protein
MTSTETLERLPGKKQSPLHITTEVVGRDFVHQVLDGLGRTLATHLVVAQPFANLLRKGYGGHSVRVSSHGATIDIIELIDIPVPEAVSRSNPCEMFMNSSPSMEGEI